MVKKMQAAHFREWLLIFLNWMAALVGLQVVSIDREMVHDGWRQIPDGHQSFDPALAEHFKTLKMRNGKHINLAVSYSVVAKWNRSNKRRGLPEWTYGSDRHYADKYTDVDRKTWGQHMEDLAALGLVEVSQMKGKPAYRVVAYQILNDELYLVHAQGYGRDAQKVAHDAQGYGHHAHPITESSITEESGKQNDLKPPAAAAREDAGAADIPIPKSPEKALDKNPMPSVKVETVVKADNIQETHPPADGPFPPVPQLPPFPVDEDCPEDPPADLKLFFNACKPGELELMIQQYSVDRIRAVIEAVKLLPNIDNPPGMVRTKLRLGAQGAWKWPEKHYSYEQDALKYISGPYAHIIQH